jgi:hypothetical protein
LGEGEQVDEKDAYEEAVEEAATQWSGMPVAALRALASQWNVARAEDLSGKQALINALEVHLRQWTAQHDQSGLPTQPV